MNMMMRVVCGCYIRRNKICRENSTSLLYRRRENHRNMFSGAFSGFPPRHPTHNFRFWKIKLLIFQFNEQFNGKINKKIYPRAKNFSERDEIKNLSTKNPLLSLDFPLVKVETQSPGLAPAAPKSGSSQLDRFKCEWNEI